MDFIYLPDEPEFLSETQVFSLNKLRDKFYDKLDSIKTNLKVKEFLSSIINDLEVGIIVEYGCGYRTIKEYLSSRIKYTGIDIDPSVISRNNQKNIPCVWINDKALNLESNSVDLVVSIFVFHFRITEHQILEVKRILTNDGIILANVYRLSDQSRYKLRDKFEKLNLKVIVLIKEQDFCKNNEYWCVYKKESSSIFQKLINVSSQKNLLII
jgi:ubiquinone/menaquinone biosynthesis C-methylase UbiE